MVPKDRQLDRNRNIHEIDLIMKTYKEHFVT